MYLATDRWMTMSGRSATQPPVPSSALTWTKVSAPTFCEPTTWRCSPHESSATRGELRSGALCSWTGTVATTHTTPEVVEGLAVGAAVRAGEVAVAPLLGEDPGRRQAVPAASR